MLSIVQAPNEILRTSAKPANIPVEKLNKILEEMKKILVSQKDPEGVGLAANQVGLPYKIFLARFETKKNAPVFTFINPEILEHSEELQPDEKKGPLEGCLSLPKYYGVVKRWKWVKLKYQTVDDDTSNLKFQISNFEGFPATVIQHEMDHLNGKIFVERILEQDGKLFKITGKDRKGKEEWEEVEI